MDQQPNVNEQEVDDVCILQSRQFNVHGGNVHEVPKLGMEFDSEQHAFDYYSEYAHRVGFSVRKQHDKKRARIVTGRTLCCSKQGELGIDKRRVNVVYHRLVSRVSCKAHMSILLQKDAKFKVISFNAEHNHAFAPSPAKHMLRSKRRLSFTQTALATDAIKVYTPEMFNMFQYEYIKAWDYSIHKVSKFENISDYKVVFGGKGREHLVKFEAETTTVQCSCMKVNFVDVLCRHALKVLDKKNIKRIPPQYILKRWTKYANDAIVSDYRGAQVQGKSQESIGKRYSYLSHDLQELVTLAAKNEDMYTYAHQNLSKLLKDLEEMKKTYCCSTLDPYTNTQDGLLKNVPQLNDGIMSQCPGGIKRKATYGRPRKRLKDPLEQPRRQKSQVKATQISTDVYSNINDEHDIADDTLPLQSQYPLISRESQERSDDYVIPSININYGPKIWACRHMSFTELLQEMAMKSKRHLLQHHHHCNHHYRHHSSSSRSSPRETGMGAFEACTLPFDDLVGVIIGSRKLFRFP
ncbi:hypothetical protein RJ640_004442 [Escallonia rubra]|uniref:Protein FAR1-RELATED SEQUENCE n=1 Tax=Escallonia rubra TaxID=112253 RepID=A0AA88QPC7_9ASTE|nr:hypothetical protein RJ640_004442 [Escallonia rubra]